MKKENIKSKIKKILKRYKVVKAGIFGSYARGEETKKSDIDILVQLKKPLGFAFVKMQFELEKEIGKKFDIITYKSINPLLKKKILNEEVRII